MVFLDIHLPHGDGFGVVREIRRRERAPARDLAEVSKAAHKLCGLVCSFSTIVGRVALDLEEKAGRGAG